MIHYLAPGGAIVEFDESKTDPFDLCNAVRERLFKKPLPQFDLKFQQLMAARNTPPRESAGNGREIRRQELSDGGSRPDVAAASGVGVRDTSRLAYRSLEGSGRLSKQQQQLLDYLRANPDRTFTRQELADGLKWGVNVVCGRVHELLHAPFELLSEGERRVCRVTRERAAPIGLRVAVAQAA